VLTLVFKLFWTHLRNSALKARTASIALFIFIALNPLNKAQAEPKTPPALLITMSGGVSLGSYEAGFMHYLIEANKKNHLYTLPVMTGASAGAINSFLSAASQCSMEIPNYEDSLLWKFWIPIGLNVLSKSRTTNPHALFSREVIEGKIAEVRTALQNSSGTCDTLLGISITRKEPVAVRLSPNLTVPRLSEMVAFRLKSKPQSLRNALIPDGKSLQILLPFAGQFDKDFELVVDALAASAAFPLAFEPVTIPYCERTSASQVNCSPKQILSSEFIDGGIYDNQPMKAAVAIAKGRYGDHTPLVLLDPTLYDYSRDDAAEAESWSQPLISYAGALGNSLIQSARNTQIMRLAEERPDISKRILHSTSNLPLNGSGLYAFMGFFEKDFRKSDFIYGMYEAKRFLNRILPPGRSIKSLPEDSDLLPWKRFKCISSILDGNRELGPDCQFLYEEEERNSLILLQASLDRLYSSCAEEALIPASNLVHCARSRKGELPPKLLPKREKLITSKVLRPSALAEFFTLLENYHFRFDDLGLRREDSAYALHKINENMARIALTMADRQPSPDNTLIKMAARPMINTVTTYTPAASLAYVSIGSAQEFGVSRRISHHNHPTPFRYQFALRTQGLTTLLGSPFQFSFATLAGAEFEFLHWSGALVQYRVGLQVGRQFGSDDQWGSQGCVAGPTVPYGWACSSWTVSPMAIITFLDKIRLQFGPLIYPFSGGQPPLQGMLHLGYQF
jgi:predicted acylesterase/phospholipase RssA